ncbi:MAG: peptidase domain-containing ABC transporter [Steroidobacteraceae bacterium]
MQKAITTAQESEAKVSISDEISTSLRALAVIACRLGLDVSVDQLRRRFALEPGEPDTPTLISLAREIGLEARSLHMTFQELPQVARALPAILRAKDGGALILEEARTDPAKGTIAIIRDPSATSDVVVAIDELHLAGVWEGEAILIKRRHSASDEPQSFSLRWLVGQVLRERKLFNGILLAALVGAVFAIAPAFVMRIVIDRVIVNQSLTTLNVLVAAVLILVLFECVLGFVRRLLTQVIVTRIDGRMQLYVEDKVLKLPMSFFERTPTGHIMTNLNHLYTIRFFIQGRFFTSLADILPLVLLIPVMVIIEWHMALMAFVLGALVFVIVLVYLKPMHNLYKKVVKAEQAKGSHLSETLYGMKTIKSLSLEGRRRRDWDHLVAELISARHEWGDLSNYPETLALPFNRLIQSGCMFLGSYLYLYDVGTAAAGSITPGVLMAFYLLSARLATPLINIAELQRDMAELRGSINQVASVVNQPPEDVRTEGLRLPIKGEVSFQDVRFRYSPDAPYALGGVSFTVPPGTMLGIMGRSGSGKTTVTRLLQCLNTDYDGTIRIDGIDLREINLMHLRTHIGVVPQENFLFSGTLRENIAMAKPDATFADVVRAAQLSGAEEFIEKLPRGYDTPIQEGGSNLSGGQRQRLALARALLIDPPVLILDEATSALDAESEAIVNANLKRMAKGRTVLSISHRLSMLVDCDAILVLEQGKVYDIGTHEELLRRCDIYKHMWHQQNRHLDPRAADVPQVVRGGAR